MRARFLSLILSVVVFSAVFAVPARADSLHITATFYPLYAAALNITRGAEGVTVSRLAPPEAGCPHEYQMTAADRRLLADTDVLVVNGLGLETFLLDLLPELSARVLDTANGLTPLAEASGEANPHIWMDVSGMHGQTENLLEGLCALNPENAALYRANGARYLEALARLEREMADALAPYRGAKVLAFDEAFDYLINAYGLQSVAAVEGEHGEAPSARELARLAEIIEAEGVEVLFIEPPYASLSAEILARETGASIYQLDLAVLKPEEVPDEEAYLAAMRHNLRTLLEALQ